MEKFKFINEESDLVENEQEKNKKILEKVEEKEINNEEDIEEFRIKKRPYFGFKTRLLIFFVAALVFFVGGCYFLMRSYDSSRSDTISYDEISNIAYNVCMSANTHYSDECQPEGMAYLSNVTQTINSTFKYDVSMSEAIDYKVKYYVEAKTSIYDKNDSSKLLYTSAENLVDNTILDDHSDAITITEDIKIPYKKYNDFVASYKSKYSINTESKLDVTLYLVEDGKSRKISSLTMGLGDQTFSIKKDNTTNIRKVVDLENTSWGEYNTVCLAVGIVLLLISLIIIIKLTSFVNKSIHTKSKYEKTLETILREYDRIIVNAKEGYVIPIDKVILELDSFNELLDARDTLEKPIVYERINEIKSQFYVEDDNKVYKYTLKEVDLEEK